MLKHLSNFMIFAHPRSGSSQLQKIFTINGLNSIYEPFNSDIKVAKYYPIFVEKGIKESLRLIQQEALGFKHIWQHLDYLNNDFLLANVPTIFLWRENTVDVAISYWIALQTRVWNGIGVKYSSKIVLSPHRISAYIDELTQELERYKRKAVGAFHLTYEQIFGQDGLDRVEAALQFAGGHIKNLEETRLLLKPELRQNQNPWSEVVNNWDDLIAHLSKKKLN